MALPMAAWRLSYTRGSWLALSGPTSLVIMMAPPPSAAPLVEELWRGTLETRTPDALLSYIADSGIEAMPHFAAFFWDTAGLHGIARGGVTVADADGAVVLDGSNTATWREERLDVEQTFTVQLEEPGDDAPALPLVVGAALVSTVTLTTAKEQLLRFPDSGGTGVLKKVPVLGLRPRAKVASSAPARQRQPEEPTEAPRTLESVSAPEPEPDDAQPSAPAEAEAVDESLDHDTQLMPEGEAQARAATEDPEADTEGAGTDLPADMDVQAFDPAQLSAESPSPAPEPLPAAPSHSAFQPPASAPSAPPVSAPSAPVAPIPPAGPRPAPVVVPGHFGEVESSDGTIFSTDLASTHKPQPEQQAQVHAAPCPQGHANPVGARECRLCKGPVDSSRARMVPPPVLAGVHTNQGEFVDLTAALVVGRSPDPAKGPAGAVALKVPSPGNDISRQHVLIEAREWNVVATDMNSTNGTLVRPVGEPEFELRDGRSVQLEIGTILDLGDGISLRIEPPRKA